MAAVVFSRPRLMRWNLNSISDHNRSELGISVERIENKQRMANGTSRKYVIADKRTFSVSWDMLPSSTTKTVDGFWAGSNILNFYNGTPGSFNLEITTGAGVATTYVVMFTDFSYDIVKRGAVDFWNLSVSMEEV